MVLSEGATKNQVTPPGIDPGTVRLVAQHLSHYATPGPNVVSSLTYKISRLIIKRVFVQNSFMPYFLPQNMLPTTEMKLIFIYKPGTATLDQFRPETINAVRVSP
jgi:hypothetical protein